MNEKITNKYLANKIQNNNDRPKLKIENFNKLFHNIEEVLSSVKTGKFYINNND